jgi:hypothetical protein
LIALKLNRRIGWTAADRLRGNHAVEGFALKMIEDVLRRVVLRAPARVSLVPDVNVHVDHARHHGLAREIHTGRSGGRRHRVSPADGRHATVLNHKRSVLDRCTAVTNDEPAAFIDNSRCPTARLRQGDRGQRTRKEHKSERSEPPHDGLLSG